MIGLIGLRHVDEVDERFRVQVKIPELGRRRCTAAEWLALDGQSGIQVIAPTADHLDAIAEAIKVGAEEVRLRTMIWCLVQHYRVVFDDQGSFVADETKTERTGFRVFECAGERWLGLNNCAGSIPVDKIRECIERHGYWSAQAGTKPIEVDGVWGGRNYPRIIVKAEELERVLELIEHG